MKYTQHKTRLSLVLLALIAELSACTKEKSEEAKTSSDSATNNQAADTTTPTNSVTASGFAYVTSQDAGVSVIDLATMKVIKQFDVKAESPRGIGITDDGKKLIVATRGNDSISVIDTATGEVLQQILIGKNPEFVRVRGNFAFISSEPSSKVGPPPKPGAK